jgi:hypothetical protein
MSRSLRSDGRARGGRIGHWLVVRVIWNHQGVQLYDLGGGVGEEDTLSIQGRKKESLDRSLATALDLGGIDVGFNTSNLVSMISVGLPEGEAEERHKVSPI